MSIRWAAMILVAMGCNRGLGSIEGYDLGNARSAAWAKEPGTDRVKVVASDDKAVCDLLAAGGELEEAIWTLSVWSVGAASYDEVSDVDAVLVLRDGLIDDDFVGGGEFEFGDAEGDLRVHVDVTFGDDEIDGRFKAEPCDAITFDEVLPDPETVEE